jgi:serine/threonine protein kinase
MLSGHGSHTVIPASCPLEARRVTVGIEQTAAWNQVAERLEAFVAAWESGPAPAIADHLPAEPGGLRRLVLVELVKVDLEFRIRGGRPARIEDYLAAHPEIAGAAGPPVELVCEEYHVRKSHGDAPDLAELCGRFPGRAEEIWRWLGDAERTMTTSLAADLVRAEFQPGETVDDFQVLAEAGKGAFATVYLARQVSMGRIVALKVSGDRGDEARTLAQLDHPHIVRIYDQRRIEAGGKRPRMRLVYEQFLPGGTLAQVVDRVRRTPAQERSGAILVEAVREATAGSGLGLAADSPALAALARLPWPAVVARIGIQLAEALAHAHAAGVLHRDVKPANVLLGADGSVHLGDFNTSSLASHPAHGPAAYFGGSLAYMSPEHLEAFDPGHERSPDDLDGRADLFSLAVLLAELLTGRRPFHDRPARGDVPQAIAEMLARRRREEREIVVEPSDPAAVAIRELLTECLAADRAARPASGGEVARRLALVNRPRARSLLSLPRGGWRRFARRRPFEAATVCMAVPNLLLAIANNLHQRRILDAFYARADLVTGHAAAVTAFYVAVGIVNLIAFPLGAWIGWRMMAGIVRRLRGRTPGLDAAALERLRRRSLSFADRMTWIAVGLWIACGVGGALLFTVQAGVPPLPMRLLFLQSSLVCGLMAAAYTFFLMMLLVLRSLYPALLDRASEHDDEAELAAAGRRSGWYLLMAGGAPLATMALMLLLGSDDRPALALLTCAGLVGLAFSFWAYGEIAADVAALIAVGRPAEAAATESRGGGVSLGSESTRR